MSSRSVGSPSRLSAESRTAQVRTCQPQRSRPLPGLVPWFGGKGILAPKILPLIPPSRKYVEAYGGAASLLMRLEPRTIEVYNDLDDQLVTLCRVLQDPVASAQLRERLAVTLYSRSEFCRALEVLRDAQASAVERAWAFYMSQCQGFAGKPRKTPGNWSPSHSGSSRGMSQNVSGWWGRIEKLSAQIERFARVQIENRCALQVIKKYDSAETVFYLDPPYVLSTRAKSSRKEYAHEQPDEHHRQLVELLPALKGKVILSGYAQEIYRPLEKQGWHRIDWQTHCFAQRLEGSADGPKKRLQRTESVWMNFPPPPASPPEGRNRRPALAA